MPTESRSAVSALTASRHIDGAAHAKKHAQHLAQDMHAVERIVAAMDVAATSIILE
jgi:hypothetical protein